MAKLREYSNQTVIDVEDGGNGIIKPEGRVVFVEGVLPGEVVDVRITRRKRDHAFGVVTERHFDSEDRIEPFCAHFAECGGCTWQYLPYPKQLEYKERFVADVLRRIGGISEPAPLPIIGCDTDRHYRNKLEWSFSPTRWLSPSEIDSGEAVDDRRALGFHVKGRFDRVIDIGTCYLQPDPSNAIRTAAREIALRHDYSFHDPREHSGLLRGLTVRTTRDGEVMVILAIGEQRPDVAESFLHELRDAVPRISSAFYLVNTTQNDDNAPHTVHHAFGTETISERCGPLSLTIHPKSFFQTNSSQAERLYSVVRDWAVADGSQTLLDLYCGIGSIGLFLADRVGRVIGVESVADAVAGARENAQRNGYTNTEFHAGDVRALLTALGRPDIVVIDPPRAGMHPDVVEALIRMRPRQIIYVSCKPATQARDLKRLLSAFYIVRIQPVDMFPQTFHIENVVDLRLAT